MKDENESSMYSQFVRSAMETWLLANGYSVHLSRERGGADYIISKPKAQPFMLEFKVYNGKNKSLFVDERNNHKKSAKTNVPIYYVGIDNEKREIAIQSKLEKKLRGAVPGLSIKKYEMKNI